MKPDSPSELRLRSEVVVQEGLIYACLIGDLLHARAVDAAPNEDLGFKVCHGSSMESHSLTVLRKPIQVCSHLDSAKTKWRTLAATPGDRGPRTRRSG